MNRHPRDLNGVMRDWEATVARKIARARAAQARHYAAHPEHAPPDDGPLDQYRSRLDVLAAAWAEVVPKAYGDPHLDQFGSDLRRLVEPWAEKPHGTLVITGPVGTGKTHLGWAALRPSWFSGRRVWAGTASQLVAALRPDASQAYRRTWDLVIAAELAYFDDLGAERQTDWSADQIAQVIHERWEADLPTIVTTNLAPKPHLRDHLGERTYSRLTADLTAIRLTGDDRRRTHP